MDDTDTALAWILAQCTTQDELQRYIMAHAVILQCLVCRMASEVHQTEEGIRALYANFADMTVEQLSDPRAFPGKKPH